MGQVRGVHVGAALRGAGGGGRGGRQPTAARGGPGPRAPPAPSRRRGCIARAALAAPATDARSFALATRSV